MRQRSKRLDTLAQWVPLDAVLVDVGCDHAWLPLSLLSQGKISRAIAIDKRPAPLALAQKHAQRTGWAPPHFQTIQNDGVLGIEIPPNAVMSIAGMGGKSVIQILSAASLLPFSLLLLQPNDHLHLVRAFLCENGWGIVQSVCIEERGQFYFALAAQHGCGQFAESVADLWLCPILRRSPTQSWGKWIRFRYRILQQAYQRAKGQLRKDALTEYTILQNLSWLQEPHLR